MYRKNKKQLIFSKLLLYKYIYIYPILFSIIFVLIYIKWDVIKEFKKKIFKKSFEIMNNMNNNCCKVELDNNFHNSKIRDIANKTNLSTRKLACDNQDLGFHDC